MKTFKMSIAILVMGAATVTMLEAGDKPLLQQAPDKERQRINPYEGSLSAQSAGRKLFQRECATCHGQSGEGTRRGPGLKSPSIERVPPGVIFWVLRNGSIWHGMPSFAHLPASQRWQIVTYLKNPKD